jgi:HlyD family secretion protein
MSLDKNALDQLRIDRNAADARKPWGWIIFGAILLIILMAFGAWSLLRGRTVEVRTAAVRELGAASERTVLNASGYVTARRQATVSSKVTGKVLEVLVEEGMEVEEGQVLARLDASNVEASLNLAQARRAAAVSALNEVNVRRAEAERNLRRIRELARNNIASEVEQDRAEAEVDSLRARLDRQQSEVAVAEQEVALWRQQLEDTIIRATFSGVVISKNAQPGEMISPISAGGGFTRTGICTIVDMQSLEIEVDVNESFIDRLKVGQPVIATLDSYPDWKISARLIAIVPAADRQKATVRVRIGFDALDPRMLPDMGIKVAFQSEEPPGLEAGLVIPANAVERRDGGDVVLVVRAGRAEQRPVTLGQTRNGEVIVLAGLKAGERVAVENVERLADGDRVTESSR